MARDRRRKKDKHNADKASPIERLTERELEVLRLVVQGKSNTEIALILIVTPHTAKKHVSSLLYKLGVRSRTEAAVIYALEVMNYEC